MIVEDHDALAAATALRLSENGHRVSIVGCAEEVDDEPLIALPDIYIIDINLPGEDGLSLARRIRKAQPEAGIIMMTARADLDDRLHGFAQGADHYLGKPVDPRELLACVDALGFRLRRVESDATCTLDVQHDVIRLQALSATLTRRESVLLAAFARAPDQSLERWQVLQLVDPHDKGMSSASLEMLISTLRRKLQLVGGSDTCLRAIRGWGYKLYWPVVIASTSD